MYYTYVIKSKKDNKVYVGYSNNLRKKFKEHNEGLVKSTKNRKPFELLYLLYYEACNILKYAIQREKALKTGLGRSYLKRR